MFSLLSVFFVVACVTSARALPTQAEFSVLQERIPATIPRNGPEALKRAYTKYGVTAPIYLTPRGQQGSVTNKPYQYGDGYIDDEYLSAISIGTPAQKFLIDLDTGSSDLWVYSTKTPQNDGGNDHPLYNAMKSSTSTKLKDYSWNITYGDGSFASGDVYTDKVTYADVTFTKQAVEAAATVSVDYISDLKFDGYLGLGHDGGNQVKPVAQKTFFTNVASSLTSPLFTVSLNHLNPGCYDFGFVDPKKYTGQLQYFPALAAPTGHGWWVVNSTGYAVGNTKVLTPISGGLKAIIDTGTTFLLMQQPYCDAYYAQAPSVVNDPEYGYIYPCKETLPDFTLAIGTYKTKIPGLLMQGAKLNSTTCFTALNPLGIGPDIPQAVYGDTFIKTTFSVFKYPPGGSPSLGFASKPINSSFPNSGTDFS